MTIVSLLVLPPANDERARKTFEFEHAMAHRAVLGAMTPLHQFSALPYFVDPMQNENWPGSKWHRDHQQGHDDARGKLASDQILRDANLNDEKQALWWTFVNHQEHHLQMGALSPPSTQNPWTYPFW